MWLVIQRQPRPDAYVWSGRRGLAAVDAVAFPALWMLAVAKAPFASGVAGAVVIAVAMLIAVRRLVRALYRNERYRFTASRLGRALAVMLFIAAALKLAIHIGLPSGLT
jgi:hypothetical protein